LEIKTYLGHRSRKNVKGVVLAAGKGTRMRAVSLGLPKILLPFGHRTIGDNIVLGLRDAGASEIAMVVGHKEEHVKRHFGDGSPLGVSIHYVHQGKPLGTGHAASVARDFVGDEPFFVLAYGDIATPRENLVQLVDDFRGCSPEASMSVYRVEDTSSGAAVYVENGYLKRLVEKPRRGIAGASFDNAGIYVFTPRVFEVLDRVGLSPRNEYELTDALTLLVREGFRVRAYELGGFWSNVSSPEDLLDVNRRVIDRLTHGQRQAPQGTASGAVVSRLALVHEEAELGRCSIGDYSIVARGARVEDAASVRHAIICQHAVVGERAVLDHVLLPPGVGVKPGAVCRGGDDKVLILPDEA
jgi:NDP-sugar pyrophosphorylase family protein